MDWKLSNIVAGKLERDGRLYPDDVEDLGRRWGVTADHLGAFTKVYGPLVALDRPLTEEEAERVRRATEQLDRAASRVTA